MTDLQKEKIAELVSTKRDQELFAGLSDIYADQRKRLAKIEGEVAAYTKKQTEAKAEVDALFVMMQQVLQNGKAVLPENFKPKGDTQADKTAKPKAQAQNEVGRGA